MKLEQERAFNREVKHIVNSDLKEFETAKSNGIQLEKVNLQFVGS